MSKTPWGEIGYVTYKRTYSRKIDESAGSTEEFDQTVDRVIKASNEQLKCNFTTEEQNALKSILLNLEGSVAGRFWWQLGTSTVDRLGLFSLQNCAFVVVDDPIRPFTWAMDALMLGSGVGYNIQKKNVFKLPKAKNVKIVRKDTNDADFIVPDSREGWVALLERVLKAHFEIGKGFSYSTTCIRGKGALIKGFGGEASGPEELCWGINNISEVINKRAGKQLRPIDCLDVMNIIGYIVVSGNIRRSAQIAVGDCDDLQFLSAKDWSKGNIPNWRAMSNNSVICNDFSVLPEQFWKGYLGNGEPYGLINLRLAKAVGRLGDHRYKDPLVQGVNPCQPAWATIMTKSGVKTLGEVGIGDEIWSREGWTKIVNKWSTGVKKVYEHRTTAGVFVGTDNHRVETPEGKEEIQHAESVRSLAGPLVNKVDFDTQSVMDGLFLGDGYYKTQAGRDYIYPLLLIGAKDKDYLKDEVSKYISHVMDAKEGNIEAYVVKTTITKEEKERTYNQTIPERLYLKDNKTTLSLLRGLYSANGSVVGKDNIRVTFKTTSKELVSQIQQMLSSVGIRSYFTTNKSKDVEFKNGTYTCKESYDINITRDADAFYSRIGFIHSYKMDKLSQSLEKKSISTGVSYGSKVETVFLGEEEVFDITVDNESHTYWTGGLSVSNCSEQFLANYETCCLAELFLPNIKSLERLKEVATYLYRINKHSLAMPCHAEETEKIVNKNMRMGIGVTGYLQASEEQKSWLPEVYEYLRKFDIEYSKANNWPTSVKLTTVKPSGTLSLLAGVTPGVHPGYSQFFIRRIRMATNSPLVQRCRENGYPVEAQRNFDGTEDRNTMVVSFPCSYPKGTVLAGEITAVDQLEWVKRLQKDWSDNAVSCTVYYKKEELPLIRKWLSDNYDDSLKAVSFLLHSEHGFQQAPYEEIDEQKYNEMKSKTTPLTDISVSFDDFNGSSDCEGGACPIR